MLSWQEAYGVAEEFRSSRLQATLFAKAARELRFKVEAGPTGDIRFPTGGPYDHRLGYQQLPALINRLAGQEFEVTAQARMSPRLVACSDRGLFATYHEKDQAGLSILDCRSVPMFRARVPERVYEAFEDVPPLLIDALLLIENRGLLDTPSPMFNPAVDWDRLSKAVFDRAWHGVDRSHASPGGSTLATQIEKYRHSPEGRTDSASEKLRQMASASLRAYIDGEETLPRRRQIVVSYLNTVPLAAKAGFGEVNGLGDALWAWYGRDFASVNQLLRSYRRDDDAAAPVSTRRRAWAFKQALIFKQAEAYKQALSLMISQRRPSQLSPGRCGGPDDAHRQLPARHGRRRGDQPGLAGRGAPVAVEATSATCCRAAELIVEHKAATAVRGTLSHMLDMPRAYDLDRLDLVAHSSIDGDAQQVATRVLRGLRDPAAARAAGLYGFHLLGGGDDLGKIFFSFTLLERGDHANLLRVQTDSGEQPFDINEGARLDLGSTAKLRTLITYLEVVAEFHQRWSRLDADALSKQAVDRGDPLGRWALDYLSGAGIAASGRCWRPRCNGRIRRVRQRRSSPRAASVREARGAGRPPRADRARGTDSSSSSIDQ